jgi:arginyl-tRNA synthetase
MRQQIIEAILAVCRELYDIDVVVELERPEEHFGDFSTNVAMRLAKPLQKNPRDLAQAITEQLQKNTLFSQVGVAGPGFINMTLNDDALIKSLEQSPSKPLSGLKVLVEYSDPNPFKPMHAGHLYTTLVGDAIARLIEHAGADIVRLNYGGDVGLHVGKTMWAIQKHLEGGGLDAVKAIADDEKGKWMGARYAEGHIAYEDNPQSKQEIIETNKKVYALHTENDHESEFAQIYWYLRSKSYDFYKDTYKRLRVVEFDRFIPESEVTMLGYSTVLEQQKKGVFEESEGAVIFDGEKFGLHKRVFINSEGLPTYETKDVGLSLTKWQDYHFDESIIITAAEQAQYMEVVIKAISQFAPEPAERTKHLTHGLLKMQGGVKMSSRLGNVLMANDVLDAAEVAGRASGQASNPEIVLGAIKYALVKTRIGGDVIYNPEESAMMEGNSGPYLQYAHARAKSILRKSQSANPKLQIKTNIEADFKLEKSERSLARKLTEYSETIEKAVFELAPHVICVYLYELSQEFNRFYENSTVIGDSRETLRIGLVDLYASTLKEGLALLGIEAPDSM